MNWNGKTMMLTRFNSELDAYSTHVIDSGHSVTSSSVLNDSVKLFMEQKLNYNRSLNKFSLFFIK